MNLKDTDYYNQMKIEYTKENISLNKLSKKYKVARSTISKWFKRDGIKIINLQNIAKFNYRIFDKINSEEKAYWLGFIYADGYVSSRDNTFELSLGLKDTIHLIKFAKFLEYENNIKTDSFRCRFSVTNRHFHKKLNELGIIPKKSLVIKFPDKNILPLKLYIPFIRGYFDGDGYVGTNIMKNKRRYYNVALLGTKHFLTAVLNFLDIKSNLRLANKNGAIEAKQFELSKNKGLLLLIKLYSNSKIHLERKYKKYKEFAVLASNS